MDINPLSNQKNTFENLVGLFEEQDKVTSIYILEAVNETTQSGGSQKWRDSLRIKKIESLDPDDLRTVQNVYKDSVELKEIVTFNGQALRIDSRDKERKTKEEMFNEIRTKVIENLKLEGSLQIQTWLVELILFNARQRMVGAFDFLWQQQLLKMNKAKSGSTLSLGKKISKVNWTINGYIASADVHIIVKSIQEINGSNARIWGSKNKKLVELENEEINSGLRKLDTLLQLRVAILINNQGRMRGISYIASHTDELSISAKNVIKLKRNKKNIGLLPSVYWKYEKNYPLSLVGIEKLDFNFEASVENNEKNLIINGKQFTSVSRDILEKEVKTQQLNEKSVTQLLLCGDTQIFDFTVRQFKELIAFSKNLDFMDYKFRINWQISNNRIFACVDCCVNILEVDNQIKSSKYSSPLVQFRSFIEIQIFDNSIHVKLIYFLVESLIADLKLKPTRDASERPSKFVIVFDQPQDFSMMVGPIEKGKTELTGSTDSANFSLSFKRGFQAKEKKDKPASWPKLFSGNGNLKKTSDESNISDISDIFRFREGIGNH